MSEPKEQERQVGQPGNVEPGVDTGPDTWAPTSLGPEDETPGTPEGE